MRPIEQIEKNQAAIAKIKYLVVEKDSESHTIEESQLAHFEKLGFKVKK